MARSIASPISSSVTASCRVYARSCGGGGGWGSDGASSAANRTASAGVSGVGGRAGGWAEAGTTVGTDALLAVGGATGINDAATGPGDATAGGAAGPAAAAGAAGVAIIESNTWSCADRAAATTCTTTGSDTSWSATVASSRL